MKLSYDIYNVFYYVCRFKNITLAANYLHVSQPAVTRQIKNLEMHLGCTLFVRTKKGLSLTNTAEDLFEEVSVGIEAFNNIESKYNSNKKIEEGTIKILCGYATTKSIILPKIQEFNKKYPKVKIYIEHYPFKEAINKLRNGEVDMLLLNTEEYIGYNDLTVTPFYKISDILVAHNKMKNQYPSQIKLEEINNYPIICKKNHNNTKRFIQKQLELQALDFKPMWELTDYWLVEEYIKMNMGIGIVSKEFIQKELNKGSLIEIKTDIPFPERSISYAIRKNCVMMPELIKFIKFLIK